jgi:hypothetical protein
MHVDFAQLLAEYVLRRPKKSAVCLIVSHQAHFLFS